jgi:hypothetical protein
MQSAATKFSESGLTKAWVVFHNGNKKAFRSFDTSGRYEVADPRDYGIRGLKKMMRVKFGHENIKEARLYDTATGREIEKFQNGQWVAPEA